MTNARIWKCVLFIASSKRVNNLDTHEREQHSNVQIAACMLRDQKTTPNHSPVQEEERGRVLSSSVGCGKPQEATLGHIITITHFISTKGVNPPEWKFTKLDIETEMG